MLELEQTERTMVFVQIVKQCHVTEASVRMWEREDTSPQEWRIMVINHIAKKYGCVVVFPPKKKRNHLDRNTATTLNVELL